MINSSHSHNIKAHIVEQDAGKHIDFWYDPPITMWCFHLGKMAEDLEQELTNAVKAHLHEAYNAKTKTVIIAHIEYILKQWMYAGYLSINPIWETWNRNQNERDTQ